MPILNNLNLSHLTNSIMNIKFDQHPVYFIINRVDDYIMLDSNLIWRGAYIKQKEHQWNTKDQLYTYKDMFFKPYESKFIFGIHMVRIFFPLILTALYALHFGILLILGKLIVGIFLASSYCKMYKEKFLLDIFETVLEDAIQLMIDTIILPLSIFTLFTRSISTGLKVAEIYDYDSLGNNCIS